jgi:hypothetical protein
LFRETLCHGVKRKQSASRQVLCLTS